MPPASMRTLPSAAAAPLALRTGPGNMPLRKMRLGCQTPRVATWSGKALGSPASLKASRPRMAEAVWWPWVLVPVGEKRVTMTSGWKVRMTRTTSLKTSWRSQILRVSSGFLEKPKSSARVKNWRPLSSRRAAKSSSVRIRPSSEPNSPPRTFWPPSPRVMER